MNPCTISAELEVEDVAHAAVDDAKEALILFLELSLIEYLYCDDTRFFYGSCPVSVMGVSWGGLHIERLVPVGVEGFADDLGRLGLFTIDGQHGKRVWESCSESAMKWHERAYGRHLV
jgi:hypothetical protein